jgi:predicted phage tail protein|nr:MAG TPA: tail assembly protein [Caudoviricetes sp.]
MLTKIYLEGAMGRNFGREWTLDIHTPAEALQLIQANIPRFGQWIRDNLKRYEKCMIICKYADGRVEALDEKTMLMKCEPSEIHFVPTVYGAGKWMGAIVGAVMIVVGAIACCFGQAWGASLIVSGAGMLVSTIITVIMGRTRKDDNDDSGTSYYFNGAQNTTRQGVPVPLVFGRCKVGSAVISSSINVSDQSVTPTGKPGIVEVVKDRKGVQ